MKRKDATRSFFRRSRWPQTYSFCSAEWEHARCLFPDPVTKPAGFLPEGCKRPLSLISSVRRNTLWCVQTSPKWGPALKERAASCSTGSEPSAAPPAPLLRRQAEEPEAGSPPAGQRTSAAVHLHTHFTVVQAQTGLFSGLWVGL